MKLSKTERAIVISAGLGRAEQEGSAAPICASLDATGAMVQVEKTRRARFVVKALIQIECDSEFEAKGPD